MNFKSCLVNFSIFRYLRKSIFTCQTSLFGKTQTDNKLLNGDFLKTILLICWKLTRLLTFN